MKGLRTVASAVAILAGAAMLLAWFVAFLVTRSIEDGGGAHTIAKAALKSPTVMARLVDELDSHASDSLDSAGVDVNALGLRESLRSVIERLAARPDFEDFVLARVDEAVAALHDELTDPDRAPGPFVVTFDASDRVNDGLEELPVVGGSLPDVAVEPVSIELVSASTFDTARDTYGKLEFARHYLLWAGLACLALGLLVSTRRRFVIAKFLLAIGAMALLLALILWAVTPDRIASALPDGLDGTWAGVIADSIGGDEVPRLRALLLVSGAIALILGAGATVAARTLGRR